MTTYPSNAKAIGGGGVSVIAPVAVKAKGRPVVTARGTFTPTSKNEKEIRRMIIEALDRLEGFKPFDCLLSCKVYLGKDWFEIVVCPLKDTQKILRGDLDNYAKAVLDAAQAQKDDPRGLYVNDNQIRILVVEEVELEETGESNDEKGSSA